MKLRMLLLALGSASAVALAQAPLSAGSLQFRQVGTASYVCGGLGEEEQQVMKAEAGRHSLMLTFALSTGAYLADVDVQIRNVQGATILDVRCGGPIMLVDLPSAGSWRVIAQVNGQTRETTVTAGPGRSARATLLWPAGTS
jgi:hypothetical protein